MTFTQINRTIFQRNLTGGTEKIFLIEFCGKFLKTGMHRCVTLPSFIGLKLFFFPATTLERKSISQLSGKRFKICCFLVLTYCHCISEKQTTFKLYPTPFSSPLPGSVQAFHKFFDHIFHVTLFRF